MAIRLLDPVHLHRGLRTKGLRFWRQLDMTYDFKVGDHVRVSHMPGSSWQEWHGTVIDVVMRGEDGVSRSVL